MRVKLDEPEISGFNSSHMTSAIGAPTPTDASDTFEGEARDVRWVDDVRSCMQALGGRASLHQIYKAVEDRRREAGRSVPESIEATIRRTLEDHSSDSANFRGADHFANVGRGEWALRM